MRKVIVVALSLLPVVGVQAAMRTDMAQQSFKWFLWVALAWVAVMTIVVIAMWFKLGTVGKKLKKLRNDFEEFKRQPLSQAYVENLSNSILEKVERQMAHKPVPVTNAPSPSIPPKEEPSPVAAPKVRYFGLNYKDLFPGDSLCKQSDSHKAFKVTFEDASLEKGEFELVSLDRIKSWDTIEQVVDFTNSPVLLENAHDFKLIKKGKVERQGQNWKVMERLKIKLS